MHVRTSAFCFGIVSLLAACTSQLPPQVKAKATPYEFVRADSYEVSPVEFALFLLKAGQKGWFVSRVSPETIMLRNGKNLLALRLQWTDLIVRNVPVAGVKVEAVARKLGEVRWTKARRSGHLRTADELIRIKVWTSAFSPQLRMRTGRGRSSAANFLVLCCATTIGRLHNSPDRVSGHERARTAVQLNG